MTLSTEQGFPHWLALGTILRDWALVEQGQGAVGMAQIRQGLDARQAMGTELMRPYHLTLLAEAYGKGGQIEEGLREIAETLVVVDKNAERYYVAELYRLKGELLLSQAAEKGRSGNTPRPEDPETRVGALRATSVLAGAGPAPTEEAETCFRRALDVARRQQAKSLELRAAMSLSRLWQHQGEHDAARQLLTEIYGWFTEGFDTADLQEAKALLEELS